MNKAPTNDGMNSDAERAARIERLAQSIIAASQKRRIENERHNEQEMEKLKRLLNEDPFQPFTGSQCH